MRIIAAAVSSVVAVCSASAQDTPAAEPSAEERAALETCVESAEAANAARACFGIIAAGCVTEEIGGESNAGLVACNLRENAAWDGILNARYRAFRAMLDDEPALRLRDAQRAWITFRDEDCDAMAGLLGGGVMGRVERAACVTRRTGERAIELHFRVRDNQGA